MQNIGAFFGIASFTYLTHFIGRRPAFAISFVAAMLSTAAVFQYLDTFSEIFWMVPLMGFCQMALFGGYAIYFPSLFPTHCAAPAPASATTWGVTWRRRALRPGPADDQGLCRGSRTTAKSWPVAYAVCLCWGCWRFRSPPRPRASPCRSRRLSGLAGCSRGCDPEIATASICRDRTGLAEASYRRNSGRKKPL